MFCRTYNQHDNTEWINEMSVALTISAKVIELSKLVPTSIFILRATKCQSDFQLGRINNNSGQLLTAPTSDGSQCYLFPTLDTSNQKVSEFVWTNSHVKLFVCNKIPSGSFSGLSVLHKLITRLVLKYSLDSFITSYFIYKSFLVWQ